MNTGRIFVVAPMFNAARYVTAALENVLQLASTKDEALRRMADVVRSVPAFRLNAGTVLEEIPVAISALLESLQQPEQPGA